MVHADRTAPAVFLYKRTLDKRLGSTFWQAPIATPHLNTGETEFTSHSLWYEVACGIDDEVPVVGHTLANWDVFNTTSWGDAIIRGVVGTLRRTIHIDNLDVVAEHAIHLLTATRRESDGQVVEGIEQQTGHRRRIATTRTLMVYQELADLGEILTNLSRHNVERATKRQYGIHILDMRIERERAVAADTVGSSQLLHVYHHSNEVAKTSLMEHGTLGLAC